MDIKLKKRLDVLTSELYVSLDRLVGIPQTAFINKFVIQELLKAVLLLIEHEPDKASFLIYSAYQRLRESPLKYYSFECNGRAMFHGIPDSVDPFWYAAGWFRESIIQITDLNDEAIEIFTKHGSAALRDHIQKATA